MKWKGLMAVLIGLLMVGTVKVGAFPTYTHIPAPTRDVQQKDIQYYREWIQNHTFQAQVIEKVMMSKDNVYITRILYIPRKRITLKLNYEAKLPTKFMIESNRLTSLRSSELSYTTTVIVTTKDDPFEWWKVSPYLPRWTWENNGDYFVAVDPINLVWAAPKSMVKDHLSGHSWSDYTSYGGRQYIYIPGKGWVDGDDMFNGFVFTTQRHVRLWQLPNSFTVGSVHLEHWSWSKFDHVVDSYEQPEIEMLSTFSQWNREYDYYVLDNQKGDADGKASYIW